MRVCKPIVGHAVVIGCAATAALGVVASSASAATISVAKPCYVNQSRSERARMTVLGSGFVPGGQVTITSSDGSVDVVTTAGTTGMIAVTTPAPDPPFALPGEKTVTLTANGTTTFGTPATATTRVTVAPLAVGIQPAEALPTEKVTWYFSGFEPGKPVYGHYLRRKQVALTRFGRAHGACGVLRSRAPLYPGGHPRYHLYGLQIDDSSLYSKRSTPQLDKKILFQYVSGPPAHPSDVRPATRSAILAIGFPRPPLRSRRSARP